jgi:hypothetical protein
MTGVGGTATDGDRLTSTHCGLSTQRDSMAAFKVRQPFGDPHKERGISAISESLYGHSTVEFLKREEADVPSHTFAASNVTGTRS